ncbi:MAG: hypothetical protein AB1473_17795 [Thermodesulfobacteriota bacterium]
MKRFLLAGACILVMVFSGALLSAQEVYWDGEVTVDDTITDKDTKLKIGEPLDPDKLYTQEIYDSRQLPEIDEPSEFPEVSPEPTAIPRPTTVTPAPRRPASVDQPRTTTTRQPTTPGRSPRRSPGTSIDTSPATTDQTKQRTQTQAVDELPPKPDTKKMPWGQVDVKPAEPKDKPLQWGR